MLVFDSLVPTNVTTVTPESTQHTGDIIMFLCLVYLIRSLNYHIIRYQCGKSTIYIDIA